MDNATRIWNYLKGKGFNDCACAGIIGNLDCESGLNPKNLQNTYEARLGFTDESYVRAIDAGTYSREQFATDGAGAFLAQWTWHTRKRSLYDFAKSRGVSIGDLDMQLDFFYNELSTSYRSVMQSLMAASTVREASDIMLLRYECPYDSGPAVQTLRASYSQKYYNRFAKATVSGGNNMGYLKYKKGNNTAMSDFFGSTEMDCHGNGCCGETIVNETLIKYLTQIRQHFGKPITITSGYRCPVHNRNVGGATGSRHGKGDAADIVVAGVSPRIVTQYAESIGILGIGLYETKNDGHFVHIDTRDYKSFWYGQAQEKRTTFGVASSSGQNVGVPTSSPSNTNKRLLYAKSSQKARLNSDK